MVLSLSSWLVFSWNRRGFESSAWRHYGRSTPRYSLAKRCQSFWRTPRRADSRDLNKTITNLSCYKVRLLVKKKQHNVWKVLFIIYRWLAQALFINLHRFVSVLQNKEKNGALLHIPAPKWQRRTLQDNQTLTLRAPQVCVCAHITVTVMSCQVTWNGLDVVFH